VDFKDYEKYVLRVSYSFLHNISGLGLPKIKKESCSTGKCDFFAPLKNLKKVVAFFLVHLCLL